LLHIEDYPSTTDLYEKTFHTPPKQAIQKLFKNELSGHQWSQYTTENLKVLVLAALQEAAKKPGYWSGGLLLLVQSVKKQKSPERILFTLNSYLLS